MRRVPDHPFRPRGKPGASSLRLPPVGEIVGGFAIAILLAACVLAATLGA